MKKIISPFRHFFTYAVENEHHSPSFIFARGLCDLQGELQLFAHLRTPQTYTIGFSHTAVETVGNRLEVKISLIKHNVAKQFRRIRNAMSALTAGSFRNHADTRQHTDLVQGIVILDVLDLEGTLNSAGKFDLAEAIAAPGFESANISVIAGIGRAGLSVRRSTLTPGRFAASQQTKV